MVCIVVSGVPNSGKTGSIKHAIKKFLEMDDTVIHIIHMMYVGLFHL